jgi:endonuclease YncB( thermonuclease family)
MKMLILTSAAFVGAIVGLWPSFTSGGDAKTETVRGCFVTDGDTIRCGDERIRLLGIDAPELPGHCRQGRECTPGDGYASGDSLKEAMIGDLRINRIGQDRYGRTLAMVSGSNGDLSCWQLERGKAIYKAEWDNGGLVHRVCPKDAR